MAGFGAKKESKVNSSRKNPQSSIKSVLKNAINHHMNGDLVNAEIGYKEAMKAGCLDDTIFINLGLIYKNTGREDQAILFYKKAIEKNPKNPIAYSNLGNLYQSLGNLECAVAYCSKSLELKPNNSEVLITLGWSQKELGNLDEALASTLESLKIKPDNPDAHMNLGGIYKDLGKLEQALDSTLKSLELKPNNPTAHMNLGIIYKDLGNLEQALDSTLKSLELKPDNPTALINLGIIYKDLGNLEQALASTLNSLELKPDQPDALSNLGGIYEELGNLNQALAATLKSLELKPAQPDALSNLGGIYRELGNLDQALAATLKSLELKPDNPITHLNLGGIYQDLGNFDQALKSFSEAAKAEAFREKASLEIATIYYKQKLYEEGINLAGKLTSKPAKNIMLAFYLCADDKIGFNNCANNLISDELLDTTGIAALDHANVLYKQNLQNGLHTNTLEMISNRSVNRTEFSDSLIEEILQDLGEESLQRRTQSLLVNGTQTSGNILDTPKKAYIELKNLLIQEIDEYTKANSGIIEGDFVSNWQKNFYNLRGWAIIMSKGGNLMSHNHEYGFLTGTFYLKMPENKLHKNEGAIVFSHEGPNYPQADSPFPERIIHPRTRDLNIFPSSIFHRTLPFTSKEQRICIAFDIGTKN